MNERWKFIELDDPSDKSLDRVGEILSEDPNMNVHVSIYKADDQSMANGKMDRIKNYIINKYQIESERVQTSWFRNLEKELIF
jgi:hypothetical protein